MTDMDFQRKIKEIMNRSYVRDQLDKLAGEYNDD